MARVRPVERGDHGAVARFMAAWPGDRRGLEFWRRRLEFWWERNPAMGPEEPRGWLLEAAEGVVGFVGNIPTWMEAEGRPLVAMNATGWKVATGHRDQSLALWLAYMAAAKGRLMLCTTPNDLALEILTGLKFRPTGAGDSRLVAHLDFRRPLELRLGPGPHLAAATAVLNLARRAELALRTGLGGRPRGWRLGAIAAPGKEVDRLWERTRGQSRLTNRRDAASLDWLCHGHPALAKVLAGAWRKDRLAGLAVWRQVGKGGERGLELMDLWWDRDEPAAPAALAWGGLDLARRERYDSLVMPLYNRFLAGALAGWGPASRRPVELRHLFLARGRLAELVAGPEAYLTGAQGDAGL
jgi:hypothetical protein